MPVDPLQEMVANRRSDLLAAARQHALARTAHGGRPGRGRRFTRQR
jgi:hypothetical protein